MSTVQQKLLKAHVALALSEELGRRPTDAELEQHLRVLTRAMDALGKAQHVPHPRKSSRGGRAC